ncbi:hypothetical protein V6N13_002136 [Hibiscus sabdariffa]|uniref:Uncharacterized protein n=1 Tax=Hibiscus sabdariffa TaxID=183260 RepID=A0ABR2C1Y2_9ROSI
MSGSVSDTASFALKDNRETQVMEKGGGRHMGIHRGTVSNGVQEPPATSEESNNVSLSEAETALKLGFESRAFPGNGREVDFLKDVPSWSQHSRTATDGNIILYAAPLLFFFYHGAAEPEHRGAIMQLVEEAGNSKQIQALGGHKTFHRKLKLVQAKTEQGQCGEVKEYVTRMLLPGLLPEEAPPKKMLDFDLNLPYQE